MTLDPTEVTRLERHFRRRIRVSLQPSTYRILGGKSYPEIAEQFKKLLKSPIRVTIGSDDPGLYTCPISGECYGDPKAFFKGILEAKNSRGRLILTDEESAKFVARYLESVTTNQRGLDMVQGLQSII